MTTFILRRARPGTQRRRSALRLHLSGLALAFTLGACAHARPEDMTASEHRAEAARHQQAADSAENQYRAGDDRLALAPRSPFADDGTGHQLYNPTAERLNEADRQMRASFEHLMSAQQLESSEETACTGVPIAERRACPLLAPHVLKVEETALGVKLHLRATAPAKALASQMQCHLAFAQARGFDRAPCPLYVKGVQITFEGSTIEVRSTDAKVAAEVRLEGRKLFGEPVAAK